MKATIAFLGGAAAGAGLLYWTDPDVGKRRRAVVRDFAAHAERVAGRAIDIGTRDTVQRFNGIVETAKSMVSSESVDDAVLMDRVRTEVGRVCSHPNVEVIVKNGSVTLQGPVARNEKGSVLAAAKAVKGVVKVINRMEAYKPLPGMVLQTPRERHLDLMQSHWAPATRVLVAALGILSGIAGLAMLARAVSNEPAAKTRPQKGVRRAA